MTRGRIWFPKRWSRAKRKRHRAGLQWLRELEKPYTKMLESIWSDPPVFDWGLFAASCRGPFIDDVELP